jgi:hypothetical protein
MCGGDLGVCPDDGIDDIDDMPDPTGGGGTGELPPTLPNGKPKKGKSSGENGGGLGNGGGRGNNDNGGTGGGGVGELPDSDGDGVPDDTDDCVPFPDNCADVGICNTGFDSAATICPESIRPSSQQDCRQARENTCTIDMCL